MKNLKKALTLTAALLLFSCSTTQSPKSKQSTKYQIGDCVSFDPTRVKGIVDGTPMLILGITKRSYIVEINHRMVSGPVQFSAKKGIFEWETKKTPCQ